MSLDARQFRTSLSSDEPVDAQVGSESDVVLSDIGSDYPAADVKFNKDTGTLIIIKENGDEVVASGFLVQTLIGRGATGPKGRTGINGRDGRDGTDGETGPTGCDGLVGATGPTGEDGEDGEDGPDGIEGEMGEDGDKGERGDDGAVGPTGPDGVRGADGICCISGPTGPTGPAPIPVAVFSLKLPTDPAVFAWCTPAERGKPRPVLDRFQPLNVSLPSPTVLARRFNGGYMFTSEFDVIASVVGGSGKFQYKWYVKAPKEVEYTENGKKLHLKAFLKALAGEVNTIGVDIRLIVYDVGQPNKVSIEATTLVKIKAVG